MKILSSIKNIHEKRKRPDSNAIFEELLKTESTITEKSLLDNTPSKFIDLKLAINKKTTNGLDSFCLTNDVQTDPTENTLESSHVRTKQLLFLLLLLLLLLLLILLLMLLLLLLSLLL